MKIIVAGSGGVGGYFGARLAAAGNEVVFIARGEHLQVLQSNGLTLKGLKGDLHLLPVEATDSFSAAGKADLILVAVKAWQVSGMAHELRQCLKDDALVLPLQNGILAMDELAAVLGRGPVLGGLCRIFSKIEAPGVIRHFGADPVIIFGEPDNRVTGRVENLRRVFMQAGIDGRIASDIRAELWMKLINICSSGLLAVMRSTYGEVRNMPETRKMMRELIGEVYAVARAAGVQIEQDFPDRTMAFIDTYPPATTSSLTRDVWEGKPSEIEYQNGTVVRMAEQLGIEVPVNRFIYTCILPMERRARENNLPK